MMALLQTSDPFEIDFLDSKINDILRLFISLHTEIFQDGINYNVDKKQYDFIFDPLTYICSIEWFVGQIDKETLDSLIELIIINLVSADRETKYN